MSNAETLNPKIFKAYDIRGIYPSEFNEEAAYRVAGAMVLYLGVDSVAAGRDMRLSSPAIAQAVIRGIPDQGAHPIHPGLATTAELHFAVRKVGSPAGNTTTASP